jgi:hypothetical protein
MNNHLISSFRSTSPVLVVADNARTHALAPAHFRALHTPQEALDEECSLSTPEFFHDSVSLLEMCDKEPPSLSFFESFTLSDDDYDDTISCCGAGGMSDSFSNGSNSTLLMSNVSAKYVTPHMWAPKSPEPTDLDHTTHDTRWQVEMPALSKCAAPVLPCRSHSPEQKQRSHFPVNKRSALKDIRRQKSSDRPILVFRASAPSSMPPLPKREMCSKTA